MAATLENYRWRAMPQADPSKSMNIIDMRTATRRHKRHAKKRCWTRKSGGVSTAAQQLRQLNAMNAMRNKVPEGGISKSNKKRQQKARSQLALLNPSPPMNASPVAINAVNTSVNAAQQQLQTAAVTNMGVVNAVANIKNASNSQLKNMAQQARNAAQQARNAAMKADAAANAINKL